MEKYTKFENKSQEKFFNSLCKKIKCTDNPKKGFLIRSKESAVKYKYIELNSRLISYFSFDVDRKDAGASWLDADLPVPTFTIKNPQNGHAHLLYSLSTPYSTTEKSSQKIILYANLIRTAFQIRLGADPAFRSALLTKNPLCDKNEKNTIINNINYSFADLAGWLDIDELSVAGKKYKYMEVGDDATEYGRNCKLFATGRKFAYNLYARSLSGNERFDLPAISSFLHNCNTENLPQSEINSIARSIYRFISNNFHPFDSQEKIEWHVRGAIASNKEKIAQSKKIKSKVRKMYKNGYTIAQVVEELKISKNVAKTAISGLKIDKSPHARCKAMARKMVRENNYDF